VPPVPPWLARTWLIGGVVGAIAGVGAAILAWSVLGSAATASTRSIDLADGLLDSLAGTVVSVEDALVAVAGGLRTSQQSAADAAITLTQLSALTSNLGELISEDVPGSLDSVRASLAPIEATAGVLDGTLRALSFFGVDYDPETPLDEAIDDLDRRLAEIPTDLRRQGPLIDSAADSLNGFGSDTLVIAGDLSDLRRELIETGNTINGYQATIDDAAALLSDVETNLAGRLGLLKWVMVFIAIALAITQTIPITFGLWLLQTDESNTVDVHTTGE
jgi:ABC-type transporter Mla subunit MlaD